MATSEIENQISLITRPMTHYEDASVWEENNRLDKKIGQPLMLTSDIIFLRSLINVL